MIIHREHFFAFSSLILSNKETKWSFIPIPQSMLLLESSVYVYLHKAVTIVCGEKNKRLNYLISFPAQQDSNSTFDIDGCIISNLFQASSCIRSVRCDVPVNCKTSMIDFVKSQDVMSTQSLRGVHMGKMCACAFIG